MKGLTPLENKDVFGVEYDENWGYVQTSLPDGREVDGKQKGEDGRYLGFYENVHEGKS